MTDSIFTPANIIFAVGIVGTIFTVYNYFRNPQIKSEREEVTLGNSIEFLKEKLTTLSTAFQAHILSDQNSFAGLSQHIVEVDKSVTKLTTIIDERIPKKE